MKKHIWVLEEKTETGWRPTGVCYETRAKAMLVIKEQKTTFERRGWPWVGKRVRKFVEAK